jgi:hypothetical protein
VSAHSAGAYTATLLVMVNVMRGGGRAPPTLTSQGLILPSRLNVRQKAAVATLCPHYSGLAVYLCRRYAVFLSNVLDDSLVQAGHILPKKRHYSNTEVRFIIQVPIGIPLN